MAKKANNRLYSHDKKRYNAFMDRNIYKDLMAWKQQPSRKPLLLKGARQVGKTYLLKMFGKNEFSRFHLFDFAKEAKMAKVFEGSLAPLEIIKRLEILFELKIDPKIDLIIFDEIQQCPAAITALKYFCDDLPEAFVIGSGSFLGVSLSSLSYPVGKIKTMTLYPMSFFEFLAGINKEDILSVIINETATGDLHAIIHEKAFEYLKYYFITGGLPEVVQTLKDHIADPAAAFRLVRELQSEMVDNYLNDMSKHAGKTNAVKIQAVFNNIPLQLAREDKTPSKFVFKDVLATRSNFQELEDPIAWLEKAGLVHKVPVCKRAESPLKAYTDINRFKLYLFDVGLLGCLVGLEPKEIYAYDYGGYKGYFAENYVVQELKSVMGQDLYSWQEGQSEIELLLSITGQIVPIEVKAGLNTKAKSLKVYRDRYAPKKCFLVSANPVSLKQTGQSLLPLYAVGVLASLL